MGTEELQSYWEKLSRNSNRITSKRREKFRQAIEMAQRLGNERLTKKIRARSGEMFRKTSYRTETQTVTLQPITSQGLILDIGGGGEGIIGKLNGKQVLAIDTSEEELRETDNEALKIVMDASKLKFLPETFSVCTAFFSFMYIPQNKYLQVFKQVRRVLKGSGRFLIWDVVLPESHGDYRIFTLRLKATLPNEEVETGYATLWDHTQNIDDFRECASKTQFTIIDEWVRGRVLFLEMKKNV